MPRSQNDTPVPSKERPLRPFSPSDLVIPTLVCTAVSVLLFLAFQPEALNENSGASTPMSQTTTATLEKWQRTAEVAEQLLRRDDISLKTANSCLTRIARQQNKDRSTVCLQTIQSLPKQLSREAERRWAALLHQHVDTATLKSLIQIPVVSGSFQNKPNTIRLAWAALVARSSGQLSALFKWAAQDIQHMANLLQAIPIVADSHLSQQCDVELRRWIFIPRRQHPDSISDHLMLVAMECVMKLQIDQSSKVSTFCQLALADACRPECFQYLNQLNVHSISPDLRGPIAAALLQHLANRSKQPRTIDCQATWAFAESLAEVFKGHRRQRFEKRLLEIRGKDGFSQDPSQLADRLH